MIKLTALFGQPKDPTAFERYYAEIHLPLAAKISGARHVEFSRVTGSPDGSAPATYRISEFHFDDLAHMGQVLGTPEARAVVEDLKNFATGGVTMLVSEIETP